ncbi:MAG: glycosyltransferase [Rhizobiales bacterium]|nr:glycosyltransferase [Hyphomicrobiales bacterium]
MLSVIIPTEGEETPVVATLAALVPGVTAGLIQDVVLVDRGETDTIARVADVAGCGYLVCRGSRAEALAAGVKEARAPWLMFLHPGTVPELSWIDETAQFIDRIAQVPTPRAAILRYARSPYADQGLRATVARTLRLLSGPSPDQGLVIARQHFEALGGYPAGRRDAERTLLRKLGRARLMLRSRIMVPE